MSNEARDEQDLIALERAASGDPSVFGDFVRRHQSALFRLARALTSSDAVAEDVLQETFVAAFRNAGQFRGESTPRTWLMTIARRAASRSGRRRAGEPAVHVPLHELGEAAGWGDDPERSASQTERRDVLRRALEDLSEEDRVVIVLRDLEGLSGPETAEVLGLSLAATKTRLHRARLRLMAAVRKGGAHGDGA